MRALERRWGGRHGKRVEIWTQDLDDADTDADAGGDPVMIGPDGERVQLSELRARPGDDVVRLTVLYTSNWRPAGGSAA